jgi:hypothetical protein
MPLFHAYYALLKNILGPIPLFSLLNTEIMQIESFIHKNIATYVLH